jgi:hypothetical protein
MKLFCKSRFTEDGTLLLGTQSNPERVQEDAISRARYWARDCRGAKSFTLLDFHHTTYSGIRVSNVTGYSRFRVQYFSTATEGEHSVEVPA